MQVAFVGGRTQPGTIKPEEEGDRHPYSVLDCADNIIAGTEL